MRSSSLRIVSTVPDGTLGASAGLLAPGCDEGPGTLPLGGVTLVLGAARRDPAALGCESVGRDAGRGLTAGRRGAERTRAPTAATPPMRRPRLMATLRPGVGDRVRAPTAAGLSEPPTGSRARTRTLESGAATSGAAQGRLSSTVGRRSAGPIPGDGMRASFIADGRGRLAGTALGGSGGGGGREADTTTGLPRPGRAGAPRSATASPGGGSSGPVPGEVFPVLAFIDSPDRPPGSSSSSNNHA
ncbi:MAG: hypothetical protein JW940_23725 [Polyangiaceae bacterium]|nr:hypothetical protein [Polyangiaceae bacterium]